MALIYGKKVSHSCHEFFSITLGQFSIYWLGILVRLLIILIIEVILVGALEHEHTGKVKVTVCEFTAHGSSPQAT